jgi:hypothetical protein
VPLDDLLADRQADAGAVEFLALVQPLEHAEDSVEVLRLDPSPLSLHRKAIHFLPPLRDALMWTRGAPPRWYLMALPTRF